MNSDTLIKNSVSIELNEIVNANIPISVKSPIKAKIHKIINISKPLRKLKVNGFSTRYKLQR